MRLQWGHGLAAVDGTRRSTVAVRRAGFNGATALRPWTAATGGGKPVGRTRLQWGHGLAAVDGEAAQATLRARHELQWGHGLAAVDGNAWRSLWKQTTCFNGATALRPWTA